MVCLTFGRKEARSKCIVVFLQKFSSTEMVLHMLPEQLSVLL